MERGILVADCQNHAVRMTMAGAGSTLAGNGQKGYADGEGAAARLMGPIACTDAPCSYQYPQLAPFLRSGNAF